MDIKKATLPLLLLSSIVAACNSAKKPSSGGTLKTAVIKNASFESAENSLWSLENTDPAEEAQKAISAGDTRFLGIRSYALSVPGVPPDAYQRYVSKDTVRIIVGTSDFVSDDAVRRLMQKAGPYAERYNKRVVEHLRR